MLIVGGTVRGGGLGSEIKDGERMELGKMLVCGDAVGMIKR